MIHPFPDLKMKELAAQAQGVVRRLLHHLATPAAAKGKPLCGATRP